MSTIERFHCIEDTSMIRTVYQNILKCASIECFPLKKIIIHLSISMAARSSLPLKGVNTHLLLLSRLMYVYCMYTLKDPHIFIYVLN